MKVDEKPGRRAFDHIVNKSTTVSCWPGECCWETIQSGTTITVSNKQRPFSAKAGYSHLCPNWNSCRVLSLLCHTAIPPTLASVSLASAAASTPHPLPLCVANTGCRPSCPQRCCSVTRLTVEPPSKATKPLRYWPTKRRSLYSNWLSDGGGLAAPQFYVTFPARPEVLTNCTSNPVLHMSEIMCGITLVFHFSMSVLLYSTLGTLVFVFNVLNKLDWITHTHTLIMRKAAEVPGWTAAKTDHFRSVKGGSSYFTFPIRRQAWQTLLITEKLWMSNRQKSRDITAFLIQW